MMLQAAQGWGTVQGKGGLQAHINNFWRSLRHRHLHRQRNGHAEALVQSSVPHRLCICLRKLLGSPGGVTCRLCSQGQGAGTAIHEHLLWRMK